VDFTLIASLNQLPLTRGPATPGGDPSPGPESRVFWGLTLITLVAAAVFALSSLLIAVVGQCVALRMRRGFRQRAVHALIWLPTVVIALVDFVKLIVLQSVINKLRWQQQWCSLPSEPAEIRYTFEAVRTEFGASTTDQPPCATSPLAQATRIAIIVALISVGFNTLVFFAREPRRLLPKLLAVAPAAALTALLWVKPVTAMMVFAFAQRWYTDR